MVSLPGGKKLKMCLFVSTESTNVTDRRTDGRTPHDGIDRAYIASRCKNRRNLAKRARRKCIHQPAAPVQASIKVFSVKVLAKRPGSPTCSFGPSSRATANNRACRPTHV